MNRLEKINDLIEKYGLKNTTRRRDVLFKRYFVYNELRNHGLSLTMIGEIFGKNHATVLHGLRVHKDMLSYRDADYVAETCAIQAELNDLEFPNISKVFKRDKYYDLKEDLLEAKNYNTFKRIQRRVKMGFYEKNSTFVGDRAANTSEANQEPREGGLLCSEVISNQQARNS
jgi:hypothetical protein